MIIITSTEFGNSSFIYSGIIDSVLFKLAMLFFPTCSSAWRNSTPCVSLDSILRNGSLQTWEPCSAGVCTRLFPWHI